MGVIDGGVCEKTVGYASGDVRIDFDVSQIGGSIRTECKAGHNDSIRVVGGDCLSIEIIRSSPLRVGF